MIVIPAIFGLFVFLVGEAAIDLHFRHADEDFKLCMEKLQGWQNQASGTQFDTEQPRKYPIPDELVRALTDPNSFHTYRSVADIPGSVRSAFAKVVGEGNFSMADPNRRWQETDLILDPRLPRRRLTAVALRGQLCLLFYEHGGRGKNDNVAVFLISGNQAEPIWHAYVAPDIGTPAALAIALQEKSYLEDTFF